MSRPSGDIFDYEGKQERLTEVQRELEDPGVWNDQERAQSLGRERASLEAVVVNIDELSAGLADADELVYDINDSNIFDGTSCEGEKASIKVREWEDASTGAFQDKITDFANLRFTDNGMAWVIAVVPADNDGFEIPQPATASRLDEFGVLGSGTSTSDTTVPDTVADTTADTVADTTADTTADSVADTTTPGTPRRLRRNRSNQSSRLRPL